MAELPKKAVPDGDIVIPVRTGGELSLVSLSGKPAGPVVAPPTGTVEKAVQIASRPEWGEQERARLRQIVLSFFMDVRDRQELREELTRALPSGGLGVGAAEADWMVTALAAIRDGKPLPIRPAAKVVVAGVAPSQPERALPLAKGELEGVKAPSAVRPEFAGKRREEIFAVLAKEIFDEVQPKLPDPHLRSRLEALVVTRFRDVRDANETRAHLARATAEGGLGMESAEIERLMAVVEDRFAKIGKELHAQEKERVVSGMRSETAAREQKRDSAARMAQFADSAWFEDRFVRTGTPAAAPGRGAVPLAPPPPAPPVVPPPPVRVPSPPPTPPIAAPTPYPLHPTPPQKPTMRDVDYRPKLTGPVEELAKMTLADFRRLARDPGEATKRILDKIRLMEEEDYARRAAAIAAWRTSEPVRTYLTLTRTMLEKGSSLAETIAGQGAAPDALTLQEYNAIMELQNSLRY